MLGLRHAISFNTLTLVFKTHHHHTFRSRLRKTRAMADDGLADALEEQLYLGSAAGRSKGKGRSGGGGRRGGGGGGGGGGARSRSVEVSKALSRLLRHQAENAGIKLDDEGYAPLDRVLKWGPLNAMSLSLADIQSVVTSSDKQRFALKPKQEDGGGGGSESTDPADWLIRANQGHSIKLDSEALLRPISLEAGNIPDVVVHGTYFRFWPLIVSSGGLKRMGRNHVHCSTGLPEDERGVISGMRRDAQVLVYVDVEKSLRDGALKWWISDNGVVLTEGDAAGLVPAIYFKEVVGRKMDVGLLWKDGEKVADLPAGVKGSMPSGKERVQDRDGQERTASEGGASGGSGNRGRGRGRGQGRGR